MPSYFLHLYLLTANPAGRYGRARIVCLFMRERSRHSITVRKFDGRNLALNLAAPLLALLAPAAAGPCNNHVPPVASQ